MSRRHKKRDEGYSKLRNLRQGEEPKGKIFPCGRVKAVILENGPDQPNLVANRIYDTKPVHYLSMVSDQLRWKCVSKLVFNIDTDEMELLEFLWLN